MNDGSDFEAAFHPYVMRGFTNEEMDGKDGYFSSFGDNADRILSDAVKKKIQFYCGRHPALLMEMRKHMLKADINNLNVDHIWQQNESFARVYEKMCDQMEKDCLPHQHETTLMDAFMYQFVYFTGATDTSSYKDPDQQLYVDRLVNAGFAMKPDWSRSVVKEDGVTYYPDIFFRAGKKEKDDITKALICEPLSPYFLTYIDGRWKPERSKGAAQHLGWTERALRSYIEGKLKSRYKDYWRFAVRAALNPEGKSFSNEIKKLDVFMRSLERLAESNRYTGELSSLDVLSFIDYYSIIAYYWGYLFESDFSKYGLSEKNVLLQIKDDFSFLYECRNAKAHENLKVLSTESIRRVQDVCTRLDSVIVKEA